MRNLMIAIAALFLFGCGEQPPEFFSIDAGFSEPQRETIRAAVAAWCDAVDWCPTEVEWTERGRFQLVDDLPERDTEACETDCRTAGRNHHQDVVQVARNRYAPDDLAEFWILVAHEMGHFCIDGHTKRGLMAAVHETGESLDIDADAIAAWHDGC